MPGRVQTFEYAGLSNDSEATATERMQHHIVPILSGHRDQLLVGEAALRHTAGSCLVMAAQVRQLTDILTRHDNVDIDIGIGIGTVRWNPNSFARQAIS
ncbi:Scr1 family TA system antitoxin-like transcriptional regulator [Nocardia sp. NPDC051833]|uniref:Scr1 family TA system antitoxin-like transcriptional regulator n=1 Tax=Nocardia sp. NPDC051833 TaxID=3155674 RepID=UPI0034120F57